MNLDDVMLRGVTQSQKDSAWVYSEVLSQSDLKTENGTAAAQRQGKEGLVAVI